MQIILQYDLSNGESNKLKVTVVEGINIGWLGAYSFTFGLNYMFWKILSQFYSLSFLTCLWTVDIVPSFYISLVGGSKWLPASVFLTVSITVERYQAVTSPYSYQIRLMNTNQNRSGFFLASYVHTTISISSSGSES